MAQPRWDEQEVALLLDAYQEIENGKSWKSAAEDLSTALRSRAINRGLTIDAQFRNVNGMIMQLRNQRAVAVVILTIQPAGRCGHTPLELRQRLARGDAHVEPVQ